MLSCVSEMIPMRMLPPSPAGMAKAPLAPAALRQLLSLLQLGAADLVDHQLGDPVAVLNSKGFFTQVDHDAADLPPVVGIDGARRVEQGHPVLQGKPAARPDLGLVPLGQGNGDAGGDELPLTRL